MSRRQFFRSLLLAFAGLPPGASVARPAQTRAIPLQISPVAGFQYHEGGTLWPLLCEGHALDLVREPANTYDQKAVRVEWRGICRTFIRQIPEAKPLTGPGRNCKSMNPCPASVSSKNHASYWVWLREKLFGGFALSSLPDHQFPQAAWHKLGYVPRTENHAVAQLLDRGEKLSARIVALRKSDNPWERVRFAVLLQA